MSEENAKHISYRPSYLSTPAASVSTEQADGSNGITSHCLSASGVLQLPPQWVYESPPTRTSEKAKHTFEKKTSNMPSPTYLQITNLLAENPQEPTREYT